MGSASILLAPAGMLPDGQRKHGFCRPERAACSESDWQNASQSEQNARAPQNRNKLSIRAFVCSFARLQ